MPGSPPCPLSLRDGEHPPDALARLSPRLVFPQEEDEEEEEAEQEEDGAAGRAKRRRGGRQQQEEQDDGGSDDESQFRDEWDDELYGDADDRGRLAAMTQMEREMILTDRADKRDRAKMLWEQRRKEEAAAKATALRALQGPGTTRASDRRKGGSEAVAERAAKSALRDIAAQKLRRARKRGDDDDDDDAGGAGEDDEAPAPRRRGRGGSDDDNDDDYYGEDDDDDEGGKGRRVRDDGSDGQEAAEDEDRREEEEVRVGGGPATQTCLPSFSAALHALARLASCIPPCFSGSAQPNPARSSNPHPPPSTPLSPACASFAAGGALPRRPAGNIAPSVGAAQQPGEVDRPA